MLLIDGVQTLANIVIVDFTWVDLILQVVFSYGVVVIVAAQAKDGLYCN
jgi:hypothetical protein